MMSSTLWVADRKFQLSSTVVGQIQLPDTVSTVLTLNKGRHCSSTSIGQRCAFLLDRHFTRIDLPAGTNTVSAPTVSAPTVSAPTVSAPNSVSTNSVSTNSVSD